MGVAAVTALGAWLVAYGGGRAAAVLAAVLVYRAVSFWLALPIGWAAWAVLAAKARRALQLTGTSPAGTSPAGTSPAVPVPAASPAQCGGHVPGETVTDWVRAPASTPRRPTRTASAARSEASGAVKSVAAGS